jgi:deferrochelatase/peroxidase EfeB
VTGEPLRLSRRAVITAAAAAAGAWTLDGCAADGPHQQTDVLAQTPGPHAVTAAFDLVQSGRADIGAALRKLAERAAQAGSGTAVLVGLGASVFEKAGLGDRHPVQLTAMPTFPGDVLDPARTHGDVLVHVEGPDAVAVGAVLGGVAGGLRPRWQVPGFREAKPATNGRAISVNGFGFREGYGNPAPADLHGIVAVTAGTGEPDWAVGGTYQAVRIIRFATAAWDKEPVEQQEQMIGRHRDGRWLDGTAAGGEPGFATDPADVRTPLDSHVRMANPRDGRPKPQLVRRGYSFSSGDDQGLLFMAFQRDLTTGFTGVQKRLAGEKLARYVLPVGGGYFFVPAPAKSATWWGAPLFGA